MNTQKIIQKWYHALKFPQQYDEAFYAALKTVTVDETALVENYDEMEQDGKKNFLYFLYFCERMQAQYQEKGIDNAIFLDTVQDLVRWTNTWSDLKGELYLGEIYWLKLIFSMNIIKLGRLQFARAEARADVPAKGLKKGEPVLDIHIPATGPLDREECLKSFETARNFFPQYYPEFDYKCFTCHSWLLDDTLRDILKEGSNILQFQTLFDIVDKDPSPMICSFVFRWKITTKELASVVCKSSLQRVVKEQVLSGRQFYEGYGVIAK